MIYLEKEHVLRLKELGFKPPYDNGETYAYQFYNYRGEEWSIGGKITGEETILAPQEVYRDGIRLFNIEEIFDWIHFEGLGMRLHKNINSGYKFIIFDEDGKEYKGNGGDLHHAVFNSTEKYLITKNLQNK
ncbi:hypothetical protein [Bacillus sp. FJAT-27245]|uniref:hypothetical protein n=1 Tax=Bacillus sp. FJAT-27245 TaxID=1684144 RepID=UPI0006A7A08D|nr:hypothetical protein [Bacillus sp. FJAT-27245]